MLLLPSLLLFFWFHLFLLSTSQSPSLSIPFLPANNFSLHGDAHLRNNAISLTQEHSCSSIRSATSSSSSSSSSSSPGIGRAFYVYPIRFLDTPTNTTPSFSCHFSFSIIQSPLCRSGDGIAFLITSNPDSFSLSNGYLGLPGPALNPKDSFFAVEFDTASDPSLGDINDNHIGIDINTVQSFASIDAQMQGIDLKSGRHITSWINYTDEAKLIQVWVSYSEIMPPTPILVAQVDLSLHFKEYMHVGFSASNGQGSAGHVVYQWRFRTKASLPSLASMDTVEEGDCFMCYSDDDSNDEDTHDSVHERRTKIEEMALGLGGLAAFVLSITAILAVIFYLLMRKKKKKMDLGNGRSSDKEHQISRIPKRLSIADIRSATMGFHPSRIVGRGASATVYKGCLPSTMTVAVKRFDREGMECVRNPFITEFAAMVGCLRHKNLVQLQGWCCEGKELVLVYEYLPNGSLDQVLHKKTRSAIFLSWKERLNIVLGVAAALSYLHEECERQIIHRDVKTCNIMLDEALEAKLGDFGLAEVYEHSSMTRAVTIPAGTMGYLAPEYVYHGVPTVKTDVYSFGVVVLEVATGRRPVEDGGGTVLVDWVWGFWEEGKLTEAADPKLKGKVNGLEMERLLMVGLSCVHPNHEKRPTVRVAAKVLRGEAPLPVLPTKKPTMGFRSIFPDASYSAGNLNPGEHSPTADDVTWMTPKSHFG